MRIHAFTDIGYQAARTIPQGPKQVKINDMEEWASCEGCEKQNDECRNSNDEGRLKSK